MIDIENIVVDAIEKAFDGVASVSSVYVEAPEEFPWVYVHQVSNSAIERLYDDTLVERAARITIRVEHFSNKASGAKEEVKAMMQISDQCMGDMKFTRTRAGLIPNYDRSVTRGYCDYSAVVGEPQEIDGNTVFQMYRS